MSHRQALAQVTAQAAQAHSHMPIQTDYSTSLSAAPATSLTQLPAFNTTTTTYQEMTSSVPGSSIVVKESSDISQPDQRSQSSSFTVDNIRLLSPVANLNERITPSCADITERESKINIVVKKPFFINYLVLLLSVLDDKILV